jgi:hypothetical protein
LKNIRLEFVVAATKERTSMLIELIGSIATTAKQGGLSVQICSVAGGKKPKKTGKRMLKNMGATKR